MFQFQISSVLIPFSHTRKGREPRGRDDSVALQPMQKVKRRRRSRRVFLALSLGVLSLCASLRPTWAAERLIFSYPPFGDFSLSVDSLERFAEDGTITDELAFYVRQLNPQQVKQLQTWLQTRWDVSPVAMAQVTYSTLGESVLMRLGEAIRTESDLNSFHALRSALILAASPSEGLTFVSVLRQFPIETIKIDLNLAAVAIAELSGTLGDKEAILAVIRQQAKVIPALPATARARSQDLRASGVYRWQQNTFSFNHPDRGLGAIAEIYRPILPAARNHAELAPLPTIVISHGVGSDRQTFAYLAEHLASHGFFVAVLEHPDSNGRKLAQFLAGLDRAPDPELFVNQPLEISALLDALAARDRADPNLNLNLNRVGVIGQSLGGYAALVVGGAEINGEHLRQICQQKHSFQISFNLSQLLQCQATLLSNLPISLQDDRVQAVFAINPVSSRILGPEGLSQLEIPVAIVASENDLLTPMIAEQIYPFTWLQTPEKYLAVIENGTHFSFIGGEGKSALPVPSQVVGPPPDLAYPYLKALSTAFFKTHITLEPEYRSYLNPTYANSISQAPFDLHLLQSLSAAMLDASIADVAQLFAW